MKKNCTKYFTNKESLLQHVNEKHQNSGQKVSISELSTGELSTHELSTDKLTFQKCRICERKVLEIDLVIHFQEFHPKVKCSNP